MQFTKFTVFRNVADAMTNVPYMSFLPMYRDKLVIAECELDGMHVLRSWKNKGYLQIDGDFRSNEMVGALDYTVAKDRFKIEYIYVKDHDEMGGLDPDPKYVHAKSYNALMIAIAERRASALNMDSMIMDTHRSLRLYKRYYEGEGFELTGKKASDHGAWVEMKRKININK